MRPIPTTYPDRFRAGDSVKWTESNSDFPPSEWDLTYELRGLADISIEANVDGAAHVFALTPGETALFTPGVYHFAAIATKGEPETEDYERQTIRTGHITVLPDPAAAGAGVEALTHEERVLKALLAAYEGNADADISAYTIAGVSVTKMSRERLSQEIDRYRALVRKQKRARRKARGARFNSTVKGVF